MRYTLLCIVSCAFGTAHAADGQYWSQFRGPRGDSLCETALPERWSAQENVAWKMPIPGVGWSQPIVWGDKIFVTTAVTEDQVKPDPKNNGPGLPGLGALATGAADLAPPDSTFRWQLICLDGATGNILWDRTAREGRPAIRTHPNNTYASETPATDGERVIAYFGMTGVYSYDLEGTLLWSKELGVFPMFFGWGTGSSPVMDEERVFIQCDNDSESFLLALDKRTGDELWRMVREENSNWSTPYLWRNRARTELVVAGGGKMRSNDPKSGALLWEMKGNGRTSASPVGDQDLLYLDSADRLTGIRGRLVAVRPGASGDISLSPGEKSSKFVAWATGLNASRLASPLLLDGRLYVLEQGTSIVHVFNAGTGEEVSRKRLPGAAGFTASPWAGCGKAYCLDQSGATFVLAPGDEWQLLATNRLDEMCWASAAVMGERLLLRSVDHLYCLGAPFARDDQAAPR